MGSKRRGKHSYPTVLQNRDLNREKLFQHVSLSQHLPTTAEGGTFQYMVEQDHMRCASAAAQPGSCAKRRGTRPCSRARWDPAHRRPIRPDRIAHAATHRALESFCDAEKMSSRIQAKPLVVVGPPGCGKSALLVRLLADDTADRPAPPSGSPP